MCAYEIRLALDVLFKRKKNTYKLSNERSHYTSSPCEDRTTAYTYISDDRREKFSRENVNYSKGCRYAQLSNHCQ